MKQKIVFKKICGGGIEHCALSLLDLLELSQLEIFLYQLSLASFHFFLET